MSYTNDNTIPKLKLGDNCIVFENFTASIGDLMVANWVYWRRVEILKTSPEELSDVVSLTNADLEITINTARHALSLLYDLKGKCKSCEVVSDLDVVGRLLN